MELWAFGPAMKFAAASKRVTTGRALAIVSTMAPATSVAVIVGTSFTAAIFILMVVAGEEDAEPSDAVTVKVLIPFSLVAGTYVRLGRLAKAITCPAEILAPESFKLPVAGRVAMVMLTNGLFSISE